MAGPITSFQLSLHAWGVYTLQDRWVRWQLRRSCSSPSLATPQLFDIRPTAPGSLRDRVQRVLKSVAGFVLPNAVGTAFLFGESAALTTCEYARTAADAL